MEESIFLRPFDRGAIMLRLELQAIYKLLSFRPQEQKPHPNKHHTRLFSRATNRAL